MVDQETAVTAALNEQLKTAVKSSVRTRTISLPSNTRLEEMETLKALDAELDALEEKLRDANKRVAQLRSLAGKFFSDSMKARGLDPFEILGLDPNLQDATIGSQAKQAKRDLLLKYHSDKTGVSSGTFDTMMELVGTAFRMLTSELSFENPVTSEAQTALQYWRQTKSWEDVTRILDDIGSSSQMTAEDFHVEELEGPTLNEILGVQASRINPKPYPCVNLGGQHIADSFPAKDWYEEDGLWWLKVSLKDAFDTSQSCGSVIGSEDSKVYKRRGVSNKWVYHLEGSNTWFLTLPKGTVCLDDEEPCDHEDAAPASASTPRPSERREVRENVGERERAMEDRQSEGV
jgi:hypothetical protein